MISIYHVIRHCSKEERHDLPLIQEKNQRCLLYRDHEGRFFNLTLADHTTAGADSGDDC
jgi:hypothetical protein